MNSTVKTFALFSQEHLAIIFGGVILSVFFFFVAKLFDKRKFATITAIFIFILKLSELVYRYFKGEKIYQLLPFHLCNIALILIIMMMIFKSNVLFQFAYFWSVGAVFAIITPDMKNSLPNFQTLSFFITHFYIIFGIIYAFIYYKFRPTFEGYISAFFTLNIIALIVFFINRKLGTNYLFVNRIPSFSSPLSYFGAWPYYLIVVEGIYLVLSTILYIPTKKKKIKFKCKKMGL